MNSTTSDPEFLGIGWRFPPATDAGADMAMVAYEEDVRQAIRIILGTSTGERVMRPDFGAGLKALVFEPANMTTMALAKQRVEEALLTWEPRIDLQSVEVTTEAPMGNKLLINIAYRIRRTNAFYNLVYPFYLAEGERP